MPRYQDLRTCRTPPGARGRPAWFVQFWWIVQALLFNTSPQVLFSWRRFLLRLFGAKIGAEVLIRPSARVTYPWKLEIGNYSWVGDGVELYNLDMITIGENVVISQDSYLCTGSHNLTRKSFDIEIAPITIADEAWIASQVFVGPGVTIGRGSVVGVRSLVLKDLPEDVVAHGHPVKILRTRTSNEC
jgi:putative colanic acid biosynthesis acetyltransferase WcaF